MPHMLYILVKAQLFKLLDQKTQSGSWSRQELPLILFRDAAETEHISDSSIIVQW